MDGNVVTLSQDKIRDEVAGLWVVIFGAPPHPELDAALMLEMIVEGVEIPDYDRLAMADRARDIVWPKPGQAAPGDQASREHRRRA